MYLCSLSERNSLPLNWFRFLTSTHYRNKGLYRTIVIIRVEKVNPPGPNDPQKHFPHLLCSPSCREINALDRNANTLTSFVILPQLPEIKAVMVFMVAWLKCPKIVDSLRNTVHVSLCLASI